jgi:hypothetical protein
MRPDRRTIKPHPNNIDRMADFVSGRLLEKPELHERGNAIVETDLLKNVPVLHSQNGGSGEMILRPVAAGRWPIRKSLNAGPVCVPPPSVSLQNGAAMSRLIPC